MTTRSIQLRINTGDGRVFRTASHIGFLKHPILGLYDAVLDAESDGSEVFKRLAALIVRSDFSLSGFVVVRLTDDPAAFAFGDVELVTGVAGQIVAGDSSATWTERPLSAPEVQVLRVGADPEQMGPLDTNCSDTVLDHGMVEGGGFVLGNVAALATATDSDDEVEMATDTEAKEEVAWEPPVVELIPAADEEDLVEVDPDFDPFADPDDVNLENIGSLDVTDAFVADDLPAAPPATEPLDEQLSDESPDLAQGAPADPPPPLGEPQAAATLGYQPPPLPGPASLRPPSSSADQAGAEGLSQAHFPPPPSELPPLQASSGMSGYAPPAPGSSMPPPPTSFPPPPLAPGSSIPSLTTNDADQESAAGSPAGFLRFDDGQTHEVRQSLYVGRFPDKQGLPDRYDSIVIRGEHVSRIHWELTVADGQVFASDLGSTSGTSIQGPGESEATPLVPGDRYHIVSGHQITFGDRWAAFES